MVMVPIRTFEFEFTVAVYETLPLPAPELPDVTVSQIALLAAVHVQVLFDAVMLTLSLPPDEV
ncbi:hypothetical protein MBAV_001149, partial [Candidatus Magnetobacterium bavaricum]